VVTTWLARCNRVVSAFQPRFNREVSAFLTGY
jgi:hypothetical protein